MAINSALDADLPLHFIELLSLKDLDSTRCCSKALQKWIAPILVRADRRELTNMRTLSRQLESSLVVSLTAKILLDDLLDGEQNQTAWDELVFTTNATARTLRTQLNQVKNILNQLRNVAPESLVPSDVE